jgi:hypothetical protein
MRLTVWRDRTVSVSRRRVKLLLSPHFFVELHSL